MNILVLNCGSSSVKYKLLNMPEGIIKAQGVVEKLGLPGSFLKVTLDDGKKVVLERDLPEHTAAIEFILQTLTGKEYGSLESLEEINAVGHRLVHGGDKFTESVLIDDEVVEKVEACIDLAPLHNPATLKGIEAVTKLLPELPQVGVFDTAFQQSMEPKSYMFPIPYEYYTKYGIRRYGFHGTSHRYVSQRACEFAGVDYHNSRIITCHIGNGASMNAIVNGKVVDTTLGLTPTDGLMMGTRCGAVDPGMLIFLAEKENFSYEELSDCLNKRSGVLGISGISSDMREIEDAVEKGHERAILALDMYEYRIKKYVGAFAAAMGGVDLIIFTGGVGENQPRTRDYVCSNMEYMGIKFDSQKNDGLRGKEALLSLPDSKVKVCVIPTDEELMIARDTYEIVTRK